MPSVPGSPSAPSIPISPGKPGNPGAPGIPLSPLGPVKPEINYTKINVTKIVTVPGFILTIFGKDKIALILLFIVL